MSALNRRHFLTSTLAGIASTGVLAACSSASKKTSGSSATSANGSKIAKGSTTTNGSAETTASDSSPSAAPAAKDTPKAAAIDKRRLVIIEMDGGNDGLSTLVPYGMTGYQDLRSRIAIDPKELLAINDKVGLHKNLKQVQSRGMAIVQGIGTPNPDGSHFAMMDRWWSGDMRGDAQLTTGFLGRLADAVGDPAARAVALSIGSGSHPALRSQKAPTLSIPRADIAAALVGAKPDDETRYAFQRALADMAVESSTDVSGLMIARRGNRDAVRFATTLNGLPEDNSDGYPGGVLSDGLKLAARLLEADPAIRIVHVPMSADFDTHDGDDQRHPELMNNFSTSVDAFLADLERRGIADQVLVATTSEFGRTVKDNNSGGTDHGTASVAMLLGPVKAGLHGEHPSLTKLDDDGQLIATVGFDQYYASIAETWFGVPASDVLPGSVKPLPDLLRV
jgi:uncharacterized protein (DUF1501 family)